MHRVPCHLVWIFAVAVGGVHAQSAEPSGATPEQRAIAFLSREVPLWPRKHACFSCHNNGDAARALFTAFEQKHRIEPAVWQSTIAWLSQPDRWKAAGDAEYKDDRLAKLQFAAALATAVQTASAGDRDPNSVHPLARPNELLAALRQAAALVAAEQHEDGSWKLAGTGTVGSPAAYGPALATVMARRTLIQSGEKAHASAVLRADTWLLQHELKNVFDAACVLEGLAQDSRSSAATQRERCLDLLRRGEATDGGWGPYLNSQPEPFDSALVLLALAKLPPDPEITKLGQRGRAYLIRQQLEDGSWVETTRPPGAQSYAQRLSTCGWCTLALLATSERKE